MHSSDRGWEEQRRFATQIELRRELMRALMVAPFISSDEALARCREGADEIGALMRENDALRRENVDLRERLRVAKTGWREWALEGRGYATPDQA